MSYKTTLAQVLSVFFEIWKRNGLKKNELFYHWLKIVSAKATEDLGQKREDLVIKANLIINEENFRDLFKITENRSLSFVMPGQERGGNTYSEESFRTIMARWEKGETFTDNYLVSFVVSLIILVLHGSLFNEKTLIKNNLSANDLIHFLCKLIDYKDETLINKIITDENFMLPFLLATAFFCRSCKQDSSLTSTIINEWIINKFRGLSDISKDSDLLHFLNDYYKQMFETCNEINVKDIVGLGKPDIVKKSQISNLYIIPKFIKDDGTACKVVEDNTDIFRKIIIANSGCGKSTFLQAVIICNVFNKISSLNQDIFNRYIEIRTELGLTKYYHPILVNAVYINNVEENELNNLKLENLAVGREINNKNKFDELMDFFNEKKELLLLIDALDEIDSWKKRKQFGTMIDSFLFRYKSTNVIITSRAIDLRDFVENNFYGIIDRLNLLKLDNNASNELSRKWISIIRPSISENETKIIHSYFTENEYLTELASNPFMLCQGLNYKINNISLTPQKILSKIINNIIIKNWATFENEQADFSADNIREVISYIAWDMMKNNNHLILEKDIVAIYSIASDAVGMSKLIRQNNMKWSMVVKDMNARAGLLILEKDGYVFQNDVIKHYLVSEWLMSKYCNLITSYDNDEFEWMRFISEDLPQIIHGEWTNVIVMMFSPEDKYNQGRRNKITPALFKYLLLRSAETINCNEVEAIGRIFYALLTNAFGHNIITNTSNDLGLLGRLRIVRYLCINNTVTGSILDKDFFQETIESLVNKKLI